MQFYEPTANDDATIESVIKQPGKQVMFLQADWCGDCKAIKPFVQQFKDAVTDGGANWVDADRDVNLAIAQEQGLMGIPAFVLFEDGQQVAHIGNGERLNPKDVQIWINEYVG